MNIVILFILNILTVLFSYASSQGALNQQKQSRAGSIRYTFESSNSLGQTPVFPQGETPLFAKDVTFFQVGDTPIPINPIPVQSIVASPISPDFELMLEEIFNQYYYSHPNLKILIVNDLEEKKRIFTVFLNFLILDNHNFFKSDNNNFEKKFREIYKIPLKESFNEKQQEEYQKYTKHEEAKEKIRQRCRIEKIIDSFIENNKKSEAA